MATKREMADRIIEMERKLGNPAPSLEVYRGQLARLPKAELTHRMIRYMRKLSQQEAGK